MKNKTTMMRIDRSLLKKIKALKKEKVEIYYIKKVRILRESCSDVLNRLLKEYNTKTKRGHD